MVKQLILIIRSLLMHNVSGVIKFTLIILHFIILPQYISYDNKTLYYIKHVLRRLKKTKIAFKHYHLINFKLC